MNYDIVYSFLAAFQLAAAVIRSGHSSQGEVGFDCAIAKL